MTRTRDRIPPWGSKIVGRRLRGYLVALCGVTAWALFAWAYLGVEDGSSGLSPLGWISSLYFMPGIGALGLARHSYSNSDLPLIAAMSWLAYAALAVALVKGVSAWRHRCSKRDKAS